MVNQEIFCVACNEEVDARLIHGRDVYPNRNDLANLPFWQCPTCKNFVGCHHKTTTPTKPLGIIPTPALKKKRQKIHELLDPFWKEQGYERGYVYTKLGEHLGHSYHTANIKSVEEANSVIKLLYMYRNYGIDNVINPPVRSKS